MKDGYILDVNTRSLKQILGGQDDLKFKCLTLAQQVGHDQFMTVGKAGDGKIHLIEFYANQDSDNFCTYSIKAIGDYY